jgi:hypothetical protein
MSFFVNIITAGNPNYTKTFVTLPVIQPPYLWIGQTYQNAAHVEYCLFALNKNLEVEVYLLWQYCR